MMTSALNCFFSLHKVTKNANKLWVFFKVNITSCLNIIIVWTYWMRLSNTTATVLGQY